MIIRNTWFDVVGCMFSKSIGAENQAGDGPALEVAQCGAPRRRKVSRFQLMLRHRAQSGRKHGERSQSIAVNEAVGQCRNQEGLWPGSTRRGTCDQEQKAKEQRPEYGSPCKPGGGIRRFLLLRLVLHGLMPQFTQRFTERQAGQEKLNYPPPRNTPDK